MLIVTTPAMLEFSPLVQSSRFLMPAPSSPPDADLPAIAADIVEGTIVGRRSVRDFSSRPVPMALVERILLAARRAPSSTNMQPWKVDRSEEHTSELQSLMRISYAVFCLKKKNDTRSPIYHYKKTISPIIS